MIWLKILTIGLLILYNSCNSQLISHFDSELALSISLGHPIFSLSSITSTLLNITNCNLQWIGGSFNFPSSSTKVLYKHSGKYNSKEILVTRGQIYLQTLFLSLPKYKKGVAATLVKTSLECGTCSPIFEPYPSWDAQEEGNCKTLQSAIDLVLDKNNKLWVLDTGVVDMTGKPIQHCPPKVVGIDVRTGTIIKTISLEKLTTNASRVQFIAIDFDAFGSTFIYVADAGNPSIIVFNVNENIGYRVALPKEVQSTSGNNTVLYMELINASSGETSLFFTYLESKEIYSIDASYLKSGKKIQGLIIEMGTKPCKIIIVGTDGKNSIIFRYEGGSDVFSWDVTTEFIQSNFILIYRSRTCSLVTHAMVDISTVRMLQSNFNDYFLNTVGCGVVHELKATDEDF